METTIYAKPHNDHIKIAINIPVHLSYIKLSNGKIYLPSPQLIFRSFQVNRLPTVRRLFAKNLSLTNLQARLLTSRNSWRQPRKKPQTPHKRKRRWRTPRWKPLTRALESREGMAARSNGISVDHNQYKLQDGFKEFKR